MPSRRDVIFWSSVSTEGTTPNAASMACAHIVLNASEARSRWIRDNARCPCNLRDRSRAGGPVRDRYPGWPVGRFRAGTTASPRGPVRSFCAGNWRRVKQQRWRRAGAGAGGAAGCSRRCRVVLTDRDYTENARSPPMRLLTGVGDRPSRVRSATSLRAERSLDSGAHYRPAVCRFEIS